MKFSKHIRRMALSEWNHQYLDYKQLKQQLKKVASATANFSSHSTSTRLLSTVEDDAQLVADQTRFLAAEAEFVRLFDDEVVKLNGCFTDKVREALTNYKALRHQVYLLEELRQTMAEESTAVDSATVERNNPTTTANLTTPISAFRLDFDAHRPELAHPASAPASALVDILNRRLARPAPVAQPRGRSQSIHSVIPSAMSAEDSETLAAAATVIAQAEGNEPSLTLGDVDETLPNPNADYKAFTAKEREERDRPIVIALTPGVPRSERARSTAAGMPSTSTGLTSTKMPASYGAIADTGSINHDGPPTLRQRVLRTLRPPPNQYKYARDQLAAAFREYYRFLDLVRAYHTLNHTACSKILKKHDKITGLQSRDVCLEKLKQEPFMTLLDALIPLTLECEKMYSSIRFGGNRKQAMGELRLAGKATVRPTSAFRLGSWTGMCLPLLVLVAIAVSARSSNPALADFTPMWLMYRGMMLPIFMLWLVAGNFWVFQKRKINFVLIFDFNPRDHLNFAQIAELAAFLTVTWCISLLCYTFSDSITFIPGRYNPLALAVFYVLFMLNPFNVLRRSARYWTLRIFGRVILSPFTQVRFADLWLGDQLISLVTALLDWEFLFCYYITGATTSTDCVHVSSGIRPFISVLPAFWRCMQCLRRYYDTRAVNPHLVNAGKYGVTLLVSILSSVDSSIREKDSTITWTDWRTTWVLASVASAMYSYIWDIKMDWSLGERAHGFLRKELAFHPKIVYYLAMFFDLVLRLFWTFTLAPQHAFEGVLSSQIFVSFLAFMEVARRCMWNLFRIENEHVSNCGQSRVIVDIPLPFERSENRESELSKVAYKYDTLPDEDAEISVSVTHHD
ncbi:xenotropic and polytropic murine leukemia virus receptor xpr1 [Capsaspora owczarzaki ATCC 30864]|uniref:Xenotropic and polytropic murine leukemia virus receptor xpr1 n=1 Tax=Capsaspora owczarzaki (strain ATCC 30864) TaxID=595528 RepID=A0A0D2X1C6_CAPO3|nr:xenotropic and polytropic murine leukemia virus receptor xpr1 [Capsaspora owczarzaki ATCC 30864]KJE90574.1 xenotropic and polytropic murine leukemia virus receptor xpr1 [Capsaspora owczarzaki ATCC 30864]|eukprot:XP_004364740.1 xenotropic and polytropic murine leukemia virus receptor xpr1 [Capsaspora owczarzaki ATCC 30864]